MSTREFFPRQSRLLIGALVLLVGLSVSFGRWYATRAPLEELAQVEQHRTQQDSATYASAMYHASHARAIRASRWSLAGYATHGVVAAVLGVALLLSGRSRRRA